MVPLPNFFVTRSGLANATGRLFYDNGTFIKTFKNASLNRKLEGHDVSDTMLQQQRSNWELYDLV